MIRAQWAWLELINVVRRAGFVVTVVTLLACSDRIVLERQAQAASTKQLIGTWDVHFHVDHPIASGPGFGSDKRDVEGQIALVANRWVEHSYPVINTAASYGAFDVDFSPLGFDARRGGEVPTAVAGSRSRDSLVIFLGDPESEIAVAMRGTASPDSIVGRWQVWISRGSGGGGRFVMVRHQ